MSDVTSDDGNHIWRKGRGWVPINEDAEMAKDALIRELEESVAGLIVGHEAKDALIRELVTALAAVGDQNTYDARRALAKAKEAGY